MKEVLKKYRNNTCSEKEWDEAVGLLQGEYGEQPLNDQMLAHWNSEAASHIKQGDEQRFKQILENVYEATEVGHNMPIIKKIAFHRLLRVAAVLTLPLLIALSVLWLRPAEDKTVLLSELVAPAGEQKQITLSDGTKVWLNAASKLTFPISFKGLNERQVHLIGEGYFEVAKNDSQAFIVKTDGQIGVRVTGTAYNISAYADERFVKVALREGSIDLIENKQGQYETLSALVPGDVACFDKHTSVLDQYHQDDVEQFGGWKDGKMVFEDEPLAGVLRRMARRYDVDYRIDDSSLVAYRISGTFVNKTLEDFLQVLAVSSELSYEISPADSCAENFSAKRMVNFKSLK
ncbi:MULTISPECIES: FecR family protein [unclassified Carboxylicivirga]|uniref:FecR family protein n=1 Tax=Carboxylicivirga TaxID=1628153 RepID=UPI003D34E5A7